MNNTVFYTILLYLTKSLTITILFPTLETNFTEYLKILITLLIDKNDLNLYNDHVFI